MSFPWLFWNWTPLAKTKQMSKDANLGIVPEIVFLLDAKTYHSCENILKIICSETTQDFCIEQQNAKTVLFSPP